MKQWIFRLLGKGPEVVVVTFCSGDPELCRRMVEEVRALVPGRRHFVATDENWPATAPRTEALSHRPRAGHAHPRSPNALRRAAYRLAPHKILAYNSRLERHHLRLDLASLLFWRGVPLDRIYLRPRWWPWPQRERSVVPAGYRVAGRPHLRPGPPPRRRALALLSLSARARRRGPHLQPAARNREGVRCRTLRLHRWPASELAPLLEFCARIVLVEKPRYREPRWSSLLPPGSPRVPLARHAAGARRSSAAPSRFEMLQVEYTQLAEYAGDILVEHDVTFDLFTQIARRERTLSAAWDAFRWRRFETRALRRFPQVVVMSEKDAEMVGVPSTVICPMAWTSTASAPSPSSPGERLLFIGSFRHFPNIAAYRFFTEEVWPLLRDKFPRMTLTVVCGADHLTYWRAFTDSPEPAPDPRIRLLGFVSDVRPALRGEQPRARPHHRFRRHQRQGPRSHGDAARRGLHHFGMRRPRSASRSQRLGGRYAGGLRRRNRHADQRPGTPRADGARRSRRRPTQLRLVGDRRKAACPARYKPAAAYCPSTSFRVVMPVLISTLSVTCRPPFSSVTVYTPKPRGICTGVRNLVRCPLIKTAAPSGTLFSHSVPWASRSWIGAQFHRTVAHR